MRKEKQFLLDEIKDQMDLSGSFVIMSYLGLKANTANAFRSEIAGLGGNLIIVRKRLLVKAGEAAGVSLDLQSLPGHIGLVFAGEDPIQVAKTVFKFKKETGNTIEVIGGRFDNQLCSAEDVETLSKLPSKDQMRAQLLSVFEAPMSQTLATMEAIMASVVCCLDNKVKQEGAEK